MRSNFHFLCVYVADGLGYLGAKDAREDAIHWIATPTGEAEPSDQEVLFLAAKLVLASHPAFRLLSTPRGNVSKCGANVPTCSASCDENICVTTPSVW